MYNLIIGLFMQILLYFLDIQSYCHLQILQIYKSCIDHFICLVLLYGST